ncbi:MAG: exodeoxyribonuclease VII large subunit [Sphingobacterium sp.]|jgi:exodeoxyribonuclease VII large subunit|uniref:exodeoxyribonuclease VII large subunit n=1 Tax=Sphingobacterium sp. TaxID=341027 RepID=UPI00282BBA15|nr:exodeoxyribonuclease VII large subunit [Sphingobacterium sp.]MDR0265247.1 exodeoxyribonuclease VII large subunit [Sphingobacterium sp.]
MPELIQDKTIFSLLEVSRSIQKTLAERYKSLYWIKAEMNKLNHYTHSGHCYPELVEKQDGKIVAEIRSILWKADYNRINSNFLKIAQEPLREGITMLFQASISYDPMYGLSLRIVDIDPTFTLGELEKEKLDSIRKLKAEGIYESNKSLAFPVVPKRLAIISVETSKGLSDFYKIINQNPWGYRIECTLFPALLQGDKSVPSIINQLAVIAERISMYDVVAIIRGGGGEVGLSSYNNYLLARAIAVFPIPVLTGIGHSTNYTVSEMVAYKNAITPSELADFLIQKFHNFAIPIDRAAERIQQLILSRFKEERHTLSQLATHIQWVGKREIQTSSTAIQQIQNELHSLIKLRFYECKTALTHTERIIQLSDPIRLLKQGFSITKVNGKLLQSVTQVSPGDVIQTILEYGELTSTVTDKSPQQTQEDTKN